MRRAVGRGVTAEGAADVLLGKLLDGSFSGGVNVRQAEGEDMVDGRRRALERELEWRLARLAVVLDHDRGAVVEQQLHGGEGEDGTASE